MHEENLKDAIFTSIFNDEEMYRKHYVPTVFYMRKNPDKTGRIKELVDNATMRFCKKNNMEYRNIPQEAKDELAEELYNEIVEKDVHKKQ